MQYLANPNRFLSLKAAVEPYLWAATLAAFVAGIAGALFASPADYQQGETVRILFVHAPAAWLALFVYVLIAGLSAVAWIFRHPLADSAAKAAAPLGATFCFLALATGSIWGKPMWGAWWVWDARLTSMFVLMLLYLGYMAVWRAFDDLHRGARLARIVALVGVVNVPIVKFSVDVWNTLHQPASIVRLDGPSIHVSILWPLLVMGLAYVLLFFSLHLINTASEIAERKFRAERLRAVAAH